MKPTAANWPSLQRRLAERMQRQARSAVHARHVQQHFVLEIMPGKMLPETDDQLRSLPITSSLGAHFK